MLYHLSGIDPTPAEPVVGRDLVRLARLQLRHTRAWSLSSAPSSPVPARTPAEPGAKRIPVAFRDIAELHSSVALFLIGLTLASQFAFHYAKAPAVVLHRGRLFSR